MSSATPRRDGNDDDRVACNAGDALSTTTQCTRTRSSGSTAFSRADTTTWGLQSLGTTARPRTAPCNVRVVSTHVLGSTASCCEPPGVKGVPASRPRTPTAIFMVPSNAQHAKAVRRRKDVVQCGLPRRNVGTADGVLRHGPHRLRVLREHVAQPAAFALQTVHRHVHATSRQVSEKNVCEAAVVEDVPDPAGSHGVRADVFAHEPRTDRREQHPVFPIDSQPTGARQHPDGASDELGGSRQVVRRASTTEEVTLTNGHHGAQLLGPAAYETLFGPVVAHQVHVEPLPLFSCSHGQNGQLTVSPKPCAVSVGPSRTRSRTISF